MTSVLENKVAKLEEFCSKPQTNSTVFDAVVELTGKLKQDFGEFKERNEDFAEKVDATFRASQENTMKLQMVENQSRLQQVLGAPKSSRSGVRVSLKPFFKCFLSVFCSEKFSMFA